MNETKQKYEDLREVLTNFKDHKLRLADLNEKVPALVKSIDDDDEVWRASFVGYWWTLEQIHEEAIEVGESGKLPAERRDAVDAALDGMLALVDQKIIVHIE